MKPVVSLWGWLPGAGRVFCRSHLPCPRLVSGCFCEPQANLMGRRFAAFRKTCFKTRVVLGPEGHPRKERQGFNCGDNLELLHRVPRRQLWSWGWARLLCGHAFPLRKRGLPLSPATGWGGKFSPQTWLTRLVTKSCDRNLPRRGRGRARSGRASAPGGHGLRLLCLGCWGVTCRAACAGHREPAPGAWRLAGPQQGSPLSQ